MTIYSGYISDYVANGILFGLNAMNVMSMKSIQGRSTLWITSFGWAYTEKCIIGTHST
jgi:hypothetical protein